MTNERRPTICLDFDGVVHHYRNGWSGVDVIDDGPTPGAKQAVDVLVDLGYDVKVYSARCSEPEGVEAIRDFLDEHEINAEVVASKPPSVLYVDDRGHRFEGSWEDVIEAAARGPEGLEPWNRLPPRGDPDYSQVKVLTVPGLEVQVHPEDVVVVIVSEEMRDCIASLEDDQDRVANGILETDAERSDPDRERDLAVALGRSLELTPKSLHRNDLND